VRTLVDDANALAGGRQPLGANAAGEARADDERFGAHATIRGDRRQSSRRATIPYIAKATAASEHTAAVAAPTAPA